MVSPATNTIRILLVDDHLVVRAGLMLIIQSQPGMTIAGEAGNSDEALALAASVQPAIILLDPDPGVESGTNLISQLIAAASSARIIALTGIRDREIHRQAVLLGA